MIISGNQLMEIGLIGQFGTRAQLLVGEVVKVVQGRVQTPPLNMAALIVWEVTQSNKIVIHTTVQVRTEINNSVIQMRMLILNKVDDM